ncbi:peptidoglycan-binding domain-containing protein [Thalassovita sp.]|uniref:peptidoglycan-binding domain-containing protein n=1 Tax=Thalassovita sp. TaxID=1979401 RepID=UPI002880CF25|nr:peptidoglycan-binding domain-containing protein [Thalassovita sp.]MDF1802007.1 peptidoglycan-binding domain-containing protein [Thalassovita sp.]
MFSKTLKISVAAALIASSASTPAFADRLGAAIVGGIIGGALVHEANKNKKKKYRSSANTVARQQNRETQTSLNYFGFPAGTPDGVMGRRSRTAVSNYQAYMGYPATGQLTQYERDFLVASYARAQIGGPQVINAMQSPQGVRGLLVTWRNEAAGVQQQQPAPAPYGGTMAAAPVQQQPMQQQPMQQQPVQQPTMAATQPLGGIQPFTMTADAPQQASLASHCSKVSLLTNSNGGFMTVSNMTDPNLALSEQFCLTRTYAISAGETMVSKVQGASQAQIDAQCDAFGPALQPYVASLSSSDALAVKAEVQKFVLGSNMSVGQLTSTAKICLYSGYRRDKMDVALGSALLMVGVGQAAYGELVGHHLSQGFGTQESAPRAQQWYGMATQALDSGVEPVFAPGQPERVGVIKAASVALTGGNPLPQASPVSALPSFNLE